MSETLPVGEDRIVGRKAGGHVDDLTGAEVAAIIGFDPTDFDDAGDAAAAQAAAAADATAKVAAEAALARNADNLSSGTVADARIASTIARDSEVTSAVSTHAGATDPHADRAYADTALALKAPIASPTFTGSPVVPGYLPLLAGGAAVENAGAIESNVNTVAATGSTETLDTSLYAVHDCTMDQACTFTFSNPAPSGKNTTFVLILRGAFTPTLPSSVKWSDAAAPTYTTPSVYVFTTVDAGTTYYARQVGKAFA